MTDSYINDIIPILFHKAVKRIPVNIQTCAKAHITSQVFLRVFFLAFSAHHEAISWKLVSCRRGTREHTQTHRGELPTPLSKMAPAAVVSATDRVLVSLSTWGVSARVLAGGAARAAVRGGQFQLFPAGSSPLQRPHHRAPLSPSGKMAVPLGKRILERAKHLMAV